MGTLRTLVGTLILSAIAYGVYVSITKNPKSNAGSSETNSPQSAANGQVTASLHGDSALPGTQNPGAGVTPLPGVTPMPSGGDESIAPPIVTLGPPVPPTPGDAASMSLNAPGSLPPPSRSLTPTPLPPATAPAPTPNMPSPGTAPAPASTGGVRLEVADFLQAIQKSIDAGQVAAAHYKLSQLYNHPKLTPEESQLVTQRLDELAGVVIYSRQHLLEPAYRVRPGETLEQIAQTYGVSVELLAKINGLRGSQYLPPGQELKVVRGPFDALVDLGRYELTLFLQGRYAGRFRIGIGTDRQVSAGTFAVQCKEVGPFDQNGLRYIQPASVGPPPLGIAPCGPFGQRRLDLCAQDSLKRYNLKQLAIHGTDSPQNIGRTGGRGDIYLGDRDIDDVYDILTVGSRVVVRR